MKIIVGSKNQNKINAAKEAFSQYPEFAGAEFKGIAVDSGVGKQPFSMEQTVEGAMARAKKAFGNCDYSVGIESGIFQVPHTKSGYMDVSICAIYDGKNFHLGGSPIFEYPKKMVDLMLEKGYEVDEAATEMGITSDPDIGEAQGMFGVLSKGRSNRLIYTKAAVIAALVHLVNPEYY